MFTCHHRIYLNNLIKVADFGLTEDIYARNYFIQEKGQGDGEAPVKLPVKWMALESLHYGLFSEKTDVVGKLYLLDRMCVCCFSGHLE